MVIQSCFSFFLRHVFLCVLYSFAGTGKGGPAGGQSIRGAAAAKPAQQLRPLHIVIYERGGGEWKVANLCEHFSLHDKVRRGGK